MENPVTALNSLNVNGRYSVPVKGKEELAKILSAKILSWINSQNLTVTPAQKIIQKADKTSCSTRTGHGNSGGRICRPHSLHRYRI